MPRELATIRDFIRWGASRLESSDVFFGHGTDNALDEAAALVLHALHLAPDLPPEYGDCRLTDEEADVVEGLLAERIRRRVPLPYLTGEAWFAGLRFKVDDRVLIPRSPIAELAEDGFSGWIGDVETPRILDLCTGCGCIAIASAWYRADAHVDAVDLDEGALAVARENIALHRLEERVQATQSDLFAELAGRHYDLVVCNPPYVGTREMDELPREYAHEPDRALRSGADGLDLPLRILRDAADHLEPEGALILEVGFSQDALSAALPTAPFLWLEFERGGQGVLALNRQELQAIRPAVQACLQERADV